MSRCEGRPSEAVRRIEAANGGEPVDVNRVYRALRRPTRFPVRFAQLVLVASDGECTLVELMDLDVITAAFEYDDPDLKRRGVEYQLVKLERRRDTALRHHERLTTIIAGLDSELASYRAQLAALSAAS